MTHPLLGTSFYGSRAFSRLWETIGGSPVYWSAEQGGQIVGLLPGIEFGGGRIRRFQSMPNGCYSRLFVEPDADSVRVARAILDGVAEAGYAKLHIFDFFGWCPNDNRFDVLEQKTSVVDISNPDWEPPYKKYRAHIRKAEREGIEVQTFDAARMMDRFLDLMRRTEERHGRDPKYPPEFFAALAELAQEDPRVFWFWVEHDGEPAATYIRFVEGEVAVNWQLYYDKKFSFLKPNQYLFRYVANLVRPLGVRWVDQGPSPEGATGLLEYKQRWGGELKSYSCITMESWFGRIARSVKGSKRKLF